MRLSVDVGGTFTDLVLEAGDGTFRLFKSPTRPDDPVQGCLEVVQQAADADGRDRAALLGECELFLHATTRATNAVLTGRTARTAFLTTEGHPDIFLLREGGRVDPFDNTVPFPEPLVPRRLTFEIPERIRADGVVHKPLDEDAVLAVIERLKAAQIEAVGVCLIWSIVNPDHEERVGALLDAHLPGVPYTLSHRLNPSLREYRRASSACIDASLKPVMTGYLSSLEARLREAGFNGRLLTVTSQGGVVDAARPGGDADPLPEFRPGNGACRGASFRRRRGRRGHGHRRRTPAAPATTSRWSARGGFPGPGRHGSGPRIRGHMTGFPSVDVRSVGAGGGSIAWVDPGGMLHVGPDSAGSVPGPACYGQGGSEPTVTDAALALGYIDADFLPGRCHRARHGSRDGGHRGKDRGSLGRGRARGCGRHP